MSEDKLELAINVPVKEVAEVKPEEVTAMLGILHNSIENMRILETLVLTYRKNLAEVQNREQLLISQNVVFANSIKALEAREEAVKHIEDVATLNKSAQDLQDDLNLRSQALQQAEEAFAKRKAEQEQIMSEKALQTQREYDNMEKEVNRRVDIKVASIKAALNIQDSQPT